MSAPSEIMMHLLKELSLLKELDGAYETGPKSEDEIKEFENRQSRRKEITDQIKALGEAAN